MTKEEFAKLRVGDIVLSQPTSLAYVITAEYSQLIATRTVRMSTPAAWDLFRRGPQARIEKEKANE